jgi:hypothetical protein
MVSVHALRPCAVYYQLLLTIRSLVFCYAWKTLATQPCTGKVNTAKTQSVYPMCTHYTRFKQYSCKTNQQHRSPTPRTTSSGIHERPSLYEFRQGSINQLNAPSGYKKSSRRVLTVVLAEWICQFLTEMVSPNPSWCCVHAKHIAKQNLKKLPYFDNTVSKVSH